MKTKRLVVLAVAAMLVASVSAREVKRGKCRCMQFRKEQQLRQMRPVAKFRYDICFNAARHMGRLEPMGKKDIRKAKFVPVRDEFFRGRDVKIRKRHRQGRR